MSRRLKALLFVCVVLLIGVTVLDFFEPNDIAFNPLLVISTLLLRTRGLLLATAAAAVSAVIGATVGLGPIEFVWTLHPFLLLCLMAFRMPMLIAQSGVAAVLSLVMTAYVATTAGRTLPWQVLGLELCGGLLGGWAVGVMAASIEALLPGIRRRAARRHGIVPPGRRLADVIGGLAAIPILTLLLINGAETRNHWRSEAQRTAEGLAGRTADTIEHWWSQQAARYAGVGQEILDDFFGYRGLPPLPKFDGEPEGRALPGPSLDRSRPGYVAGRLGYVHAVGAPTTIVSLDEVRQRQANLESVLSPIARWGPEDGKAGIEMLIPIRRDEELIGHVWAHFSEQDLHHALEPGTAANITLGPGQGLPIVTSFSRPQIPTRLGALAADASMILPVGKETAARWSLGVVQVTQSLSLGPDWQITVARPMMDIVAAGAGRNLGLMALVLSLVGLLDLIGVRLAQHFVMRLIAASGPGWGGSRGTLVDDLAETVNYRAKQLQARADKASNALAQHETLIASMPVVLFSLRLDAKGRLAPIYLSPGIHALLGRPLEDLMSADGWSAAVDHAPRLTVGSQACSATPIAHERTLTHADGTTRRVYEELTRVDGTEAGLVGVWLDVEDRKRAEERLARASHLVALGEMATGMAHELNQPLNAIRLAVENLGNRLNKATLPDDLREFADTRVKRISVQAQRAANIIDRMRVFGRSRDSEARRRSVNAAVESAVDTMTWQVRTHDVELLVDLDPTQPAVMAPTGVVEQIVINLVGNACDAVAERQHRHPSQAFARQVRVRISTEGGQARVRVSDTGGGVPETIVARIFEPFFTTKPTGKGTGLGLAISYGLASDIGGDLTVANEGEGAIFTLSMPLATAEDEE